jgi:hypothetical protein
MAKGTGVIGPPAPGREVRATNNDSPSICKRLFFFINHTPANVFILELIIKLLWGYFKLLFQALQGTVKHIMGRNQGTGGNGRPCLTDIILSLLSR